MADAGDSKSPGPQGREGSTPSSGTNDRLQDAWRRRQRPSFRSARFSASSIECDRVSESSSRVSTTSLW